MIYFLISPYVLILQGHKKDVIEGIMNFFLDQDQQHKGHIVNELRYCTVFIKGKA